MPEMEFMFYYGDEIVVITGNSLEEAWAKVDRTRYDIPHLTISGLRWSGWKDGAYYEDN